MKIKKSGLLLGMMWAMLSLAACGGDDNKNQGNGNNSQMASDNTGNNDGQDNQNDQSQPAGSAKGQVYYLSFKPESAEVWESLAASYTAETGVPVKVVTAASNTYEQTLMSEIANTDAPTLFQINGPIGYRNWKEYCADLRECQLYEWLLDKELAITGEDGGVYGIPYVVEGYGIIYNDAIMSQYIGLENARISSVEEITNFSVLKEVVEDMQARKDELGIQGVFASTSLMPGEQWRWQTHLANIPVAYEYEDKGVTDAATLDFTYAENMKNLFDLYIQNSITAPGLLGNKSVEDSMAEFALGQVAMVQNGNWAWSQISQVDGNTVSQENVKFLPLYSGIEGEENQGLCIGTENYFSINSQASQEDQEATMDFIEWLFASATGKQAVVEDLGLLAPFSTFSEEEKPDDPLAKEVLRYMEDDTKKTIVWHFTTFPSLQFKDNLGAALLEYASGSMSWDDLKQQVIEDWAEEKAAVQE
ncbi:MAG: ABC transporter substrate-binding protein [Roseburia sp.]|nr:ABC transporter substrate-binding protein [Roseburia sp.]